MWPSAYIASTHSILTPPFHCSGNSFHSSYTAKFCPITRVTASPSVLLSLRKGGKLAGTEQRTADWQLTCGSTETNSFPSKQGYTDADSGAEESILFPGIFKCFWVRGKEKGHDRCLQILYMPTSESGNIMHQNCKTNHWNEAVPDLLFLNMHNFRQRIAALQ